MIARLVSGGQTGVDRAALDIALELGLPCGGWCPRGRRAEDGTIPSSYPLVETPSREYRQRTRWNVRDSDATLILAWGEPSGGTLQTLEICRRLDKPHLVVDLTSTEEETEVMRVREWIATSLSGATLNVAGPRASQHPALASRARMFLREVLGGSEGMGETPDCSVTPPRCRLS